MKWVSFVILLFCLGCSNHYLTIQQEWIDQAYLASSYVNTPDPEKKDMVKGQKLTIGWDFPRTVFEEELTMKTQILFWDNMLETKTHHIFKKRNSISYFFPQEDFFPLLSYQIHVVNKKGEEIQVWTHQLWTELIEEN